MAPNDFLPLTQTFEPTDESAAAAIVREAGESNTPVYPIGGATRLDYGAAPERPGVGLSLAKLNRVIDYPAADLTITVEAGVTMAELARTLAERGQRLPIDVPLADRATVGGATAVNATGPRCCGHGAIRDYLLGLRAVDGRGVAFAAGGRVVKNAAGYNLCRLMAGSLGTLGVVTQVTLLVRPVPETSAFAACDLRDLASAERLLAAPNDSQTLPVAVELMAGPPRQDGPSPAPDGGEIRLVVGFEGSRAEVDWMTARLCEEWRQAGVSSLSTVGGDDAESWWRWLIDFPADLEINALPSRTVALIGRVRSLLPECRVQAHAANGVIRVQRPVGQDGRAALVRDVLRPAVAELGGKIVVLSASAGDRLGRDDVWGEPGDGIAVMRALKERFDPAGILNPGRFVY